MCGSQRLRSGFGIGTVSFMDDGRWLPSTVKASQGTRFYTLNCEDAELCEVLILLVCRRRRVSCGAD